MAFSAIQIQATKLKFGGVVTVKVSGTIKKALFVKILGIIYMEAQKDRKIFKLNMVIAEIGFSKVLFSFRIS